METQNVVFKNKALDLRLAGLLRLPDDLAPFATTAFGHIEAFFGCYL